MEAGLKTQDIIACPRCYSCSKKVIAISNGKALSDILCNMLPGLRSFPSVLAMRGSIIPVLGKQVLVPVDSHANFALNCRELCESSESSVLHHLCLSLTFVNSFHQLTK